MAKESRILMVEDDANDAALIDRELRRAGVACTTLRAASEPAFRRALHEFAPDIILVDNSLPGLNAGDAIRVASAEHPDTPVIVVTGSLDETIAAQYVQAGANDFILKHNLSRLGPAVQRALMLRRARLDRRHAEQAMRASEQRYRRLVEYSSDVITLIDGRGVITYSSESLKPTLGYAQGERTGHNVLELIHADDRAVAERLFQEVATEPGRAARGELRVQHKNGSWRDLEVVAVNHTDDPVVDAVVVNYHDVTERKRVEAALRDSEERFRQLAEHISEAFFVTDVTTESPLYVSPAWATIWGRDLAQALDARLWFSSVHPDDQPKLAASQQATLRGETSENVFRILRPDGVTRWVRGRSYPVRDAAGVIYRRVGVVEDITELRSAEGQYLHAQKMESIGRLAGGVAHDFNNLLTVISSYVSLIIEDGKPSAPVRSDLDEIQKAADSAASLTRQLLAFSRQQVLDPKSLDVNAVVRYAEKMLRRLIGEDIEVRTILQDDAGLVLADFGQLEQVIMNLAVNARDAMPSGGSLTIETASMDLTRGFFGDDQAIQAGPFVMLAVTDSGVGMDDETRAKIFEPFFTTKEPGRGTGLGLSTVYGIVKDGGGHLFVHSEPGRGTTFKVYLPRTDARAEGPATATSTATLEGTETLLIVEDVAALRDIERRVLQRKGYKVLEAPDANAAAAVSAAYAGPIHLLLTDVVLPRTNGRELAERLRATRPEMRVLFTSGYTADAVTRLGILEHGFAFMQKPFAPDTLEHKVREVLDAAGTS